MSCPSAGNCVAVGEYLDSSGNSQGLLLDESPVVVPDLSLSDTAPATAVGGQPYQYTLVADNTGGSDATGTVVADTVPANARCNTMTTSQGSCTRTPSGPTKTKGCTVSCAVGTLAAGASVTVTITVTPTKPGACSDNSNATAGNVTADSDDTASAPVSVQGG